MHKIKSLFFTLLIHLAILRYVAYLRNAAYRPTTQLITLTHIQTLQPTGVLSQQNKASISHR